MRKFPHEEEESAEVQSKLTPWFDLAEAIYQFWGTAEKDQWLKKTKVPAINAHYAMMLDVQVLRLLRSIMEQCRRCEGYVAEILCRSLFETILGVGFLLLKDVRIIVEELDPPGSGEFRAKSSSRKRKVLLSDCISLELRGKIYMTFALLQTERDVRFFENLPGHKRRGKKLRKIIDGKELAEAQKEIGPKWTSILDANSHSYCGLNAEHLAKVLRLSHFPLKRKRCG